MNNIDDNFNNNPQQNNINNQNQFFANQQETLNVIPQPINNNQNQGFNQGIANNDKDSSPNTNNFINPADGSLSQYTNNNNTGNQKFVNTSNDYNFEEINPLANQKQNKFITNNNETSSTALNDLNIDGEYHDMPRVDYSLDPKVQENLNKKNTVTITSEGKVFIIIVIVLLLFIFAMPYIFDFIRDFTYQ